MIALLTLLLRLPSELMYKLLQTNGESRKQLNSLSDHNSTD
jgi:hypothetical protein